MAKYNLLSILDKHASSIPKAIAYTEIEKAGEKQNLTFSTLKELVGQFSQGLKELEISEKPVILAYQSSVEFLIAFLGVIDAGGIPVPCSPAFGNSWKLRIKPMVDDCKAPLFIGSRDIVSSIEKRLNGENRFLLKTHEDILGQTRNWKGQSYSENVRDIAFLQYSSGSTGNPKGVIVTHDNLFNNLKSMSYGMEIDGSSCWATWLPYFHDLGLTALLFTIYHGCRTIVISPKQFLRSPLLWLSAISKYKATHTASPNFGYDYCVKKIKFHEKEHLDLSSLKCALNAAEPIKLSTLNSFKDAFESCHFPRNAFWPGYGLAEATAYVTGSTIGDRIHVINCDSKKLEVGKVVACESSKLSIVSCGRSAPNHKVVIVDPKTLELKPENEVGEILFCGPTVTKGYWNNKEATEKNFSIKITENDENSYLRTGDLGFLKDGLLYVCGRIKDLIILRGKNYYPHDIEHVAGLADSVISGQKRVAVAVETATDQKLVLVQEVSKRESDKDLEKIARSMIAAVSEIFEISISSIYFIPKGGIYYTTSGKVRRYVTFEDITNDKLEIIYRYENQDDKNNEKHSDLKTLAGDLKDASLPVRSRFKSLQEFVIEITKLKRFHGAGNSLLQMGLDSLTTVNLQNELLEHLGVDISLQELMESSVEDLFNNIINDIDIIQQQQNKQLEKQYNKVVTI